MQHSQVVSGLQAVRWLAKRHILEYSFAAHSPCKSAQHAAAAARRCVYVLAGTRLNLLILKVSRLEGAWCSLASALRAAASCPLEALVLARAAACSALWTGHLDPQPPNPHWYLRGNTSRQQPSPVLGLGARLLPRLDGRHPVPPEGALHQLLHPRAGAPAQRRWQPLSATA